MPLLWKAFWLRGWERLDTQVIPVAVTLSSTDVEEVVDANTISVAVTFSAVDTAQYVDQGTVSVIVTPSGVDTAQDVETGAFSVVVTPSSADIAQFVDQGTIGVVVIPSSSDIAQFVDASTINPIVTLTDLEEYTTYDANTVSVVVTPSGDDTAQFIESGTIPITITPSGADVSLFIDQNTVGVIVTPSSSDTAQFVDPFVPPDEANLFTVNANFILSNDYANERRAQSFTVAGNYTSGIIEAEIGRQNSPVDSLKVELCSDSASNPGAVLATTTILGSSLLSGSTAFTQLVLDHEVTFVAGTTYWLVFSRTGSSDAVNCYKIAGQNAGSVYANGNYSLYNGTWNPDVTRDIRFIVHFLPVYIAPRANVTLTYVENAQYVDQSTLPVHVEFSGSDQYTSGTGGGTEYTDSGEVYVDVSLLGDDTQQFVDSQTVPVKINVSYIETADFTDQATMYVTATPSSTDTAQFSDSALLLPLVSPSFGDLYEKAAIYVDVILYGPGIYWPFPVVLSGQMYSRWTGGLDKLRYVGIMAGRLIGSLGRRQFVGRGYKKWNGSPLERSNI